MAVLDEGHSATVSLLGEPLLELSLKAWGSLLRLALGVEWGGWGGSGVVVKLEFGGKGGS